MLKRRVTAAVALPVLPAAVYLGGYPFAALAEVAAAVGAMLSVAAQFGDLYISKLKRKAGFDDSGVIFPGHGGMLDRMDSLMLSVTAAAYLRAASVWALGSAGG